MGLFDAFREKAAELLSGATEKVSELTGTDLADAQQNATDTAQNLGDTAQGHADSVQNLGDTAQGHVDSAQNLGDTAQGHVDSAQSAAEGAVADTPVGDYLDPRERQ